PESSGADGVALASGDSRGGSSGVLDGSGVALLPGSFEDAGGKVVTPDVEGGGGRELSKSGGKIGAEFPGGALSAALFVFSCSALFFFSASFFSASFSCNG